MSRQALLEKIEFYRRQMVALADSSSLSNQEVVRVSRELDNLLNQYDQCSKKI